MEIDANLIDSTEASSRARNGGESDCNSVRVKERISSTPLLPNCIHWSQDGRVAVVTDTNIMITTFCNREMEFYMQNPPILSKSFIFFPADIKNEHIPVDMTAHKQENLGSGCTSYFLLRKDRPQNPKDISLSKNECNTFVGMEWGPRGSGPNASCAIVALSAGSRISLHFASSYQMNWTESEVFSEHLYAFLEEHQFGVKNFAREPAVAKDVSIDDPVVPDRTKRARNRNVEAKTVDELVNKCALLATLSIAWSKPLYKTQIKRESSSLIVFAGKKLVTIWEYTLQTGDQSNLNSASRHLSSLPIGWLLSENFGWITASTWQQSHINAKSTTTDKMLLALGTCEGSILLISVHLMRGSSMNQLVVDRVVTSPGSQPVSCLHLGSRASSKFTGDSKLVVGAGMDISVWSTKDESVATWKAHDANITGIGVSYFGDVIMSVSIDGCVKSWVRVDTEFICKRVIVESKPYPLYGLAVSPLSVQIALLHVMPPAARPNRKSQADMSYSRVSCAFEIMRSPLVDSASSLSDMIYRILEHSQEAASFTDVLWLCHQDTTSSTPDENALELSLPTLLHNVKGVDLSNFISKRLKKPLYVLICEKLETQYSIRDQHNPTIQTALAPILLLQASYLLRASAKASKEDLDVQEQARQKLLRSLYIFWAEQCLNVLHLNKDDELSISATEITSALSMADFLSIQPSLTQKSIDLVTSTYERFGSQEDISRWEKSVESANNATLSDEPKQLCVTLPIRERCVICQKGIIPTEFDLKCESEHTQQRCFLSFRAISSVDVWKCMGCGACADKATCMESGSPFYMLASINIEDIRCRLCGSYCILFRYGI